MEGDLRPRAHEEHASRDRNQADALRRLATAHAGQRIRVRHSSNRATRVRRALDSDPSREALSELPSRSVPSNGRLPTTATGRSAHTRDGSRAPPPHPAGPGGLGDGTRKVRLTLVAVRTWPGASRSAVSSQLAPASLHTCAVLRDTTVRCWAPQSVRESGARLRSEAIGRRCRGKQRQSRCRQRRGADRDRREPSVSAQAEGVL